MNKILFTTVAVLLGLAASAQDSIPYRSVFGNEASTWHIARFIHSTDQGGATTTVLTVLTDTTQEPEVWHPVTADGDTTLFLMESGDRSRLYLRYPDDTVAHLLMNLNLQAGDTLPVHFRNGTDTLAVVDSVYYKDGIKHLRTSLTLAFSGYVGVKASDDTPHNETQAEVPVPLTLIEGVGPNWGLDYGRENLDSILAVSPLLLCHYRDSARNYHQQVDTDYPRPDGSDNDSCTLEYIRYKSTVVPGTIWYETDFRDYYGDGTRGFVVDSMLVHVGADSILYHKINYSDITQSGLQWMCDYDPVRYLRESKDHSKVYGIFGKYGEHRPELSDEGLLFDLNLHVGDTFYFMDLLPDHVPHEQVKAIVDSVFCQDGLKHIRFAYFLESNHEQIEIGHEDTGKYFAQHVHFEFIESIGITWGYSHSKNVSDYSIMTRLMCMFRNEQLIYCPLKKWSDIWDCVLCSHAGGIDDVDTLHVDIHPNPVSDVLTIDNLPTGNKTIAIQDATGREWMRTDLTEQSARLDMSHLPRQIYLISIKLKDGIIIQKIIKL